MKILFLLLGLCSLGTLQAQGDQYSHQKQQLELYLANSQYEKALAIGLDLVNTTTRTSTSSDYRIPESMLLLGKAYTASGLYADAEVWLRRSLSHRQRHFREDDPGKALVYRALAANALRSGNTQIAPEYFDLSVEMLESAGDEFLLDLAEAHSERAAWYYFQENWDASEADYKAAMKIQENALGFQSPDLARSLNNLGGVYLRQGKFTQAKAVYDHALYMQYGVLGQISPEVATTLINLAVYHDQMGEFSEAEKRLFEALELRRKVHGPGHPLVGAVIDNLISLYLSLGKEQKGEAMLADLKKTRTIEFGGNHPLVADVLDKQAAYAMSRDMGQEAEAYMQEALTIREAHYGPRHDLVAANLYNLGKLQNINGKPEAARLTLTQALDIYEYLPSGNEAALCGLLAELVATDLAQGLSEQAEDHLTTILVIKEQTYGPNHPQVRLVLEELLNFYQIENQSEKAREIQKRLTGL